VALSVERRSRRGANGRGETGPLRDSASAGGVRSGEEADEIMINFVVE
jgi:hypothetical protein